MARQRVVVRRLVVDSAGRPVAAADLADLPAVAAADLADLPAVAADSDRPAVAMECARCAATRA
jgi:hypothetical protein